MARIRIAASSRAFAKVLRFLFSVMIVAWPLVWLAALITGGSTIWAFISSWQNNVWIALAILSVYMSWLHFRVISYIREVRQRDHEMRLHIAMMETRIAQKRD